MYTLQSSTARPWKNDVWKTTYYFGKAHFQEFRLFWGRVKQNGHIGSVQAIVFIQEALQPSKCFSMSYQQVESSH